MESVTKTTTESTESTETTCDSDIEDQLYPGSSVSTSDFSNEFRDIVSKHRLTDAASKSILNFIASILPIPNSCPSLHSLNKPQAFLDDKLSETVRDSGSYFILDIEHQVRRIIDNNEEIFNYCCSFEGDIKNSPSFVDEDTDDVKHLYLILNTDVSTI